MGIISVYDLAGVSYTANLPYNTPNRRHIRKTCKELLEGRLPRPVEKLDSWVLDDENEE